MSGLSQFTNEILLARTFTQLRYMMISWRTKLIMILQIYSRCVSTCFIWKKLKTIYYRFLTKTHAQQNTDRLSGSLVEWTRGSKLLIFIENKTKKRILQWRDESQISRFFHPFLPHYPSFGLSMLRLYFIFLKANIFAN